VLDVADRDQHVVIHTADAGSSSEEPLRRRRRPTHDVSG
jgi:hypothetical protein